ncbi:MAG: hypothetical protein K8J09_07735 [Planctomycetes bacterium]|nr:hypothetical protein [Planctomycetota bacterium]MCC7395466.1 hypothetical protein [Planctomycetota bacterium]
MKRCLPSILLLLAACGGAKPAPEPAAGNGPDLGPALGVIAAKQAGPGDTIVVSGRVSKFVSGFAMFTVMDTALPFCGEHSLEDKCETPWDYCCEKKETVVANALLVEFRGPDGKPLPATRLGDLRLLDRVSVRGKLVQGEGGLVLVADEMSRTQRPLLPDHVKWPG